MATATYDVRVGWAASSGSAFTFGSSLLDDDDVLSGQFFSDFAGTYDNVTSRVRRFATKRGRDGALDQMTAGQATLLLTDPDGLFNPRNPGGALFGQIQPMRPVRIRATYNSVTYDLFYGFVDSVTFDPEARESTITARDLFVWLGRVLPVVAATGETTTGAAIGLVLDAVGVDATARSVATGDVIPGFEADGSKNALTIIGELLATERGVFYIAGDGTATFEDRYAWGLNAEFAAFTGTMTGMQSGVALEAIRNRARVTRTGGVEQSASDGTSIGLYGAADASAVSSAYLVDDAQALALAEYLVATQRDPRPPVRGLSLINRDATVFPLMLGLELGANVEVTEPRGDTAGNFTVQAVEHVVDRGGLVHVTNLGVTQIVGEDAFVFGSSVLDGGDELAY